MDDQASSNTTLWEQHAAELMRRCAELARMSAAPDRIMRFPYTAQHRACNDRVAEWMRAAGLAVREDAVGNVWGTLHGSGPGPRRRLIIGSHLDTVPNAGAYDGILGVLAGITIAEEFRRAAVALPFDLEVVGFADEEGARFGIAMFASQAVADNWDPAWLEARDRDGTTLAEAAAAFGLNPGQLGDARLTDPERVLGFWELHIEQGPVLEGADRPLGVVTAIAGARRFRIAVQGRAGHAGTVPMAMRRDALTAAAEFALEVERRVTERQIVGTVGSLECKPGAANVIAGACTLTLDVRAADDATLAAAVIEIREAADAIGVRRQVHFEFDEYYSMPAVTCAPEFVTAFDAACRSVVADAPPHLPSGAGHDAMAMARQIPVGMLFMRCGRGGISHHPDECVDERDVALALAALYEAVGGLVTPRRG